MAEPKALNMERLTSGLHLIFTFYYLVNRRFKLAMRSFEPLRPAHLPVYGLRF